MLPFLSSILKELPTFGLLCVTDDCTLEFHYVHHLPNSNANFFWQFHNNWYIHVQTDHFIDKRIYCLKTYLWTVDIETYYIILIPPPLYNFFLDRTLSTIQYHKTGSMGFLCVCYRDPSNEDCWIQSILYHLEAVFTEHIIITKPASDLCWICQQNSTKIMRCANKTEEEKSTVSMFVYAWLTVIICNTHTFTGFEGGRRTSG